MVPNNIMFGFKRSGIYPFNPKALDYGANDRSCSVNGNCNDVDSSSIRDVGCSSANDHQEFYFRSA